jgi:hypothetical protein
MPKLTWHSAWDWSPPIAEGGTMDVCLLGGVEVGRVQKVGKQGAWICWLPRPAGPSYGGWKYEKSWLAARAALAAIRAGGGQ